MTLKDAGCHIAALWDEGHRKKTTSIVTYILVANLSTVVSTLIGSLSEYRFPHPVLIIIIRLAIAILFLVSLGILSRRTLLFARARTSRPLTSKSVSPSRIHSLTSSFVQLAGSHDLRRATSKAAVSSFSLSSTLAAVLASLVEIRAVKISDPGFWSFVHLLPALFVWIIRVHLSGESGVLIKGVNPAGWNWLFWFVLAAGPAVNTASGSEGWFCAALWTVCVTGWVLAVQTGMRDAQQVSKTETEEEADLRREGDPTILLHLITCLLFLCVPLLLSREVQAAFQSGHFGFFTEVGFWAQEVIISLCCLAKLCAFWELLRHVDPLSALVSSAFKDFSLPFCFNLLFGNEFKNRPSAILSVNQQIFAFSSILVLYLSTLKTKPSLARPKAR